MNLIAFGAWALPLAFASATGALLAKPGKRLGGAGRGLAIGATAVVTVLVYGVAVAPAVAKQQRTMVPLPGTKPVV